MRTARAESRRPLAAFALLLGLSFVPAGARAEEEKRCYCRPQVCSASQLSNPFVEDKGWDEPRTSTEKFCQTICEDQYKVAVGSFADKRGEYWDWGDNVCEFKVTACKWHYCKKTPSGQCIDDGMMLGDCTIETSCDPKPDDLDCVGTSGGGSDDEKGAYCVCYYPDDFPVNDCRRKTVYLGAQSGKTCAQVCEAGIDGKTKLIFKDGPDDVTIDQSRCSFVPTNPNNGCSNPHPPGPLVGQSNEDRNKNIKACERKWEIERRDCICKYPPTYPTETCRDKPVYFGTIWGGDPDSCKIICGSYPVHSIVKSREADVCVFVETTDQCKTPVYPNSPACAKFAEAQKQAQIAAMEEAALEHLRAQGTPLGLNLPLGTSSPQRIIGRVISQLLGVVGGVALLFFIYGGVIWMTAAGNPEKVKKGRTTVVWAVIGIAAIFAAYAFINFLTSAFAG